MARAGRLAPSVSAATGMIASRFPASGAGPVVGPVHALGALSETSARAQASATGSPVPAGAPDAAGAADAGAVDASWATAGTATDPTRSASSPIAASPARRRRLEAPGVETFIDFLLSFLHRTTVRSRTVQRAGPRRWSPYRGG